MLEKCGKYKHLIKKELSLDVGKKFEYNCTDVLL